MSEALNKLKRRRSYPVKLPAGDEIMIRSQTFGEIRRTVAIKDKIIQIGFTIGCVILGDDGTNLFNKQPDETDDAFASRVLDECELDIESATAIREAIEKVHTVPKQEVLAKNSEETSTPS